MGFTSACAAMDMERSVSVVTYRPRKGGFVVVLATRQSGELTLVGRGADGADSEAEGSEELRGNLALVSEVLRYANNEHAYRRSRSPEKRQHHRQTADRALRSCVALADMIDCVGDRETKGWCSGCFKNTSHVHVRGHDRPRRKYLCRVCGSATTKCAVPGCPHLALVKPTSVLTLRYCAEHRHEINAFEKLDSRLSTLDDAETWLSFRTANAKRVTVVAGGTLAATAVVAPLAFLAAPAVGAALGGSALGGSLTGAAATSHGLAMLGGGSIAAGGLGMVGGTAVVTATGAALGGVLGGVATSAYVSADPSFRIEQLREGKGPPVVLASGFLTEKDDGWGLWRPMIDARFPHSPVYRVHWGAKELRALGAFVVSGVGKVALRRMVTTAAKRGSRSFGTLPGIGAVFAARDLAANPWTVAKNRAGMTGAILADLVARTDESPVVLVGHSLGARVMVSAAQILGTRGSDPLIQEMHLLGAAVGRKGEWHSLDRAVSGTTWNYFSANDSVLRYLYTFAELGEQAVGRTGFRTSYAAIKDRSATRQVKGHSGYFEGFRLVTG